MLQIDRLGDGYERPAFIPLVSDDRSPLVKQMQGALVKKGSSIGPAGADGNFNGDTLTALGAFQHDNALPVQPNCDLQCWIKLGLAGSRD